MKKKLSLLLAAMLVMTLVPMSSFAYKTEESSPFTVDYGKTEEEAMRSYTIEFDLANDILATGEVIRFDLANATFVQVEVDGANKAKLDAPAVSGSFATVTVKEQLAKNDKFSVVFVVDTTDSDAGEVTLTIDNSLFGKAAYKIGTVKEESTKDFAVSVTDSKKTVSLAGGSLSKFEVKNYDKTSTVVINLDGNNAVLTKDTKINGTAIGDNTVTTKPTIAANGTITVPTAFFTTASFLVVEPTIAADRRMELGSVSVELENGDKTASATIGEIVDYNVSVKVVESGKKEIPTVAGGKETTLKVTIEGPKGSITSGRAYDIELDGATVAHNATGEILGVSGTDVVVQNVKAVEGTTSEFTVSSKNPAPTKIEFTMKTKIDATAKDGVATMTVSSRDMAEDLTVDIAKVNKAYSIDTAVTEIKRGESLAAADIVIEESKVGQIAVGEYVQIKFNGKVLFNEKPVFEATNGMKLDKVEWIKDAGDTVGVQAKVTAKSKGEPAVITISDVTVDVLANAIHNRTYTANLYVGNKAGTTTTATDFGEFDYVRCVAEYSRMNAKIVFTLGSANYTVDGVVKTLEAPVFTKDNRTMLPIGPLALALGLDVNYNGDTQTATFRDAFTGQVVSVKENASVLYNNGIEYKMHTAAVTVNGRIFVPVASITDAFGAKILWDEATQTVTIN